MMQPQVQQRKATEKSNELALHSYQPDTKKQSSQPMEDFGKVNNSNAPAAVSKVDLYSTRAPSAANFVRGYDPSFVEHDLEDVTGSARLGS